MRPIERPGAVPGSGGGCGRPMKACGVSMAGGMNGHADDGQGDFGTGVRDGTGIALGYFAISMAFGLSCVRTGLTPLAAAEFCA